MSRLAAVSASVLWLMLLLLPFVWIMRDGMGPGATASAGMDAVKACFHTWNWGPVFFATAAIYLFARWRLRVAEPAS